MKSISLESLRSKKVKLVAGLMSGTSMDGVDAALVKITDSGMSASLQVIDWITCPYPRGLKKRLLSCINAPDKPVAEISQLNFLLGELFADAVLSLLEKCGKRPDEIDLIGSHGQTLWHNPEKETLFGKQTTSTLQLGEPSVIQARTGVVTVADFRSKDVALGGEGAPLMPYFDYLYLRSTDENRGALNLGGIANISVMPAGGGLHDVFAFDTGPANMLIDQLMERLFRRKNDNEGKTAAKTAPNCPLFYRMICHDYIEKTPPKSTGREMFGAEYVEKVLGWAGELSCAKSEIISAALEFTVRSIKKNYELFIKPTCILDRIIVSGGGTHNREMMCRLENLFKPVKIDTIDRYGIPSDIKEAAAFAVYANEALHGNPINLPQVTGAKKSGISGKIIM
ncbi:anhydro-N-acetylmuramic acid kinase [candidate division KSB1 bacterium]